MKLVPRLLILFFLLILWGPHFFFPVVEVDGKLLDQEKVKTRFHFLDLAFKEGGKSDA